MRPSFYDERRLLPNRGLRLSGTGDAILGG
jgi:hypothetical protein